MINDFSAIKANNVQLYILLLYYNLHKVHTFYIFIFRNPWGTVMGVSGSLSNLVFIFIVYMRNVLFLFPLKCVFF